MAAPPPTKTSVKLFYMEDRATVALYGSHEQLDLMVRQRFKIGSKRSTTIVYTIVNPSNARAGRRRRPSDGL